MKSFINYILEKKNEKEKLSLGQEYERAEQARKEAEELRAKQREEAAEDREIDRKMYRKPKK